MGDSDDDINKNRIETRAQRAKRLQNKQFYRLARLFEDSPNLIDQSRSNIEELEDLVRRSSNINKSLSFNSKIDSFNFSTNMGNTDGNSNTGGDGQGKANENDKQVEEASSIPHQVGELNQQMSDQQELVQELASHMRNLQVQMTEIKNSLQQINAQSTPTAQRFPQSNPPQISVNQNLQTLNPNTHAEQQQQFSEYMPQRRLSQTINNSRYTQQQRKSDLSKWQIKFDGSEKGMSVDSFIFRIEYLADTNGITLEELFSDFHCLLSGNAAQWYWQLLEDSRDNPGLDYQDMKRMLREAFRPAKTDVEILRDLVDRKQQFGESFDDFYAEMHKISFGIQKKKLSESELVNIIKGNLRGQLATMLFATPTSTLAELKAECRRAEKVIKEHRQKPPARVNEIKTETENEIPSSSTNCLVEALYTSQAKPYEQKNGNNRPFNKEQTKSSFHNNTNMLNSNNNHNFRNSQNITSQSVSAETVPNVAQCKSMFHYNLCFKCGMPGDHFKKHKNMPPENVCKSTFHNLICVVCKKFESYCEFDMSTPVDLNLNLAEVSGVQSQNQESPED